MHIILNHSSMVPIYEQLMEQIKSEIINTALKEGEALPSVRSLAGELRISALTVKKAYDKLEEEGFVTTIHGKGTYVTASDKQLALEARQREAEADFEKAIDRACDGNEPGGYSGDSNPSSGGKIRKPEQRQKGRDRHDKNAECQKGVSGI